MFGVKTSARISGWLLLGRPLSAQALRTRSVAPISKPGPPNYMVGFENARFAELDFGEVLKSGRLFGTCPFSKQHLSRRVTPLSFILALCLSTFLSFLLLLYPPMSASQENITLATSLKLKIPGKSAQSHTKQDFCADMMGMRLESCMQL
jgi:hypothetical protein